MSKELEGSKPNEEETQTEKAARRALQEFYADLDLDREKELPIRHKIKPRSKPRPYKNTRNLSDLLFLFPLIHTDPARRRPALPLSWNGSGHTECTLKTTIESEESGRD